MQIHSAYFWLKTGLTEDDIQSFEEGLASLTTSETVESGHVGKPARTEPRDVVDSSYSYGLVLCFETVDAYDRYQSSDIHQQFVADHADKWDRVQVYDIQT